MVMIHSYDIDMLLRKIGEEPEDEIVGIFMGKKITRKEADKQNLWSDVRFSSMTRLKSDWKCEYCGCLRPKTEYSCGYCGGPR